MPTSRNGHFLSAGYALTTESLITARNLRYGVPVGVLNAEYGLFTSINYTGLDQLAQEGITLYALNNSLLDDGLNKSEQSRALTVTQVTRVEISLAVIGIYKSIVNQLIAVLSGVALKGTTIGDVGSDLSDIVNFGYIESHYVILLSFD